MAQLTFDLSVSCAEDRRQRVAPRKVAPQNSGVCRKRCTPPAGCPQKTCWGVGFLPLPAERCGELAPGCESLPAGFFPGSKSEQMFSRHPPRARAHHCASPHQQSAAHHRVFDLAPFQRRMPHFRRGESSCSTKAFLNSQINNRYHGHSCVDTKLSHAELARGLNYLFVHRLECALVTSSPTTEFLIADSAQAQSSIHSLNINKQR